MLMALRKKFKLALPVFCVVITGHSIIFKCTSEVQCSVGSMNSLIVQKPRNVFIMSFKQVLLGKPLWKVSHTQILS